MYNKDLSMASNKKLFMQREHLPHHQTSRQRGSLSLDTSTRNVKPINVCPKKTPTPASGPF
jgi:hypothetical protein